MTTHISALSQRNIWAITQISVLSQRNAQAAPLVSTLTQTEERPGGKADVYTHPGKETTGRQLLRPHSPKRFWNSFSNSLTNTDSRTSPEPKDAIISDILAHSSCSSKGLRMDRHWLLSMPDPEIAPLPPLREHEAGGLLVTASSPSSNFPAEPFVPDVIS